MPTTQAICFAGEINCLILLNFFDSLAKFDFLFPSVCLLSERERFGISGETDEIANVPLRNPFASTLPWSETPGEIQIELEFRR